MGPESWGQVRTSPRFPAVRFLGPLQTPYCPYIPHDPGTEDHLLIYRYFFTRNMSSIVAFAVGKKYEPGNGMYMVGAHTDSPCLKIKPVSKNTKCGFDMVNIETYGGGLFGTWFDRDLSVAGRVLVRGAGGKLEHKLVRNKIHYPVFAVLFYSTAF